MVKQDSKEALEGTVRVQTKPILFHEVSESHFLTGEPKLRASPGGTGQIWAVGSVSTAPAHAGACQGCDLRFPWTLRCPAVPEASPRM